MLQRYSKNTAIRNVLSAIPAIKGVNWPPRGLFLPIRGHFFAAKMSRLVLFVALAVLTQLFAACDRQEAPAAEDAGIRRIQDSIAAFNIPWARQEIRRQIDSMTDSDRIYKYMIQEMTCHFYLGHPDSTMEIAQKCIDYGHRNEISPARREIVGKAYRALGGVYTQYYSHPDSSIYYHQKGLEMMDDGNINDLQLCYNNLADAYKFAGRLPEAVATYRQAIFKADSMKLTPYSFVPLYSGLAGCYTELRNFDESGIWWDKTESVWPYMTVFDRSRYLNNRGNDYFYRKEYEKALEMFLRLDSLCNGNDDLLWDRQLCHVNLADVYLKLNQPEKARPLIEETSAFFNMQHNEAVMSYIYTQMMDVSRLEGDFATVDRLIAEHPMPEGIRADQAVLRLDFLCNYYSQCGNTGKALEYTRRYQALEDSLRDERVSLSTQEIKSRHERDETILQQRVTISEKESRLMRAYGIVGASVAFVLFLLVWMRLERIKRRVENKRFRDSIVEMRMENIRNRITPHFIYNALNHEILAREKGNPTQMPVLVNLLRRAQLLASDFCIPLDEELEFIQLYLTIEGHATGAIDYSLNVGPGIDLHEVILPSMTIQIFVENAVKHAFRLMQPGQRRLLHIDVSRENGHTRIEISNNGSVSNAVTPRDSTGTGMRIIFQTIQILNERNRDKIDINIERRAVEGDSLYVVTLSIPETFDFTPPKN